MQTPPAGPAGAHAVEVRVRYAETDQMGVAHHSHFLTYFEIGRTEYMRRLGAVYRDLEAQGVYLVVVEAQCRYLAPVRYDDVLEITTWVDHLQPIRIDFRHTVARKGEKAKLAEGRTVLACVDQDGRPRPLPAGVRDALPVSPS